MKTTLSHPKNMEQRNAAVSHQKTRGKKLKNMHLSFNTTKTKCYLCFNENRNCFMQRRQFIEQEVRT